MIFGVYKKEGQYSGGLFDTFEDFHKVTFSPDCEQIYLTDFRLCGGSYKEKKAAAREMAINIQWAAGLVSLYMGEHVFVSDRLETIGRRYGLLTEFRENAIC